MIDFVTNPSVEFKLASEFLNIAIRSLESSLRHQTIQSNSIHSLFEYEKIFTDRFWKEADGKVIDNIKILYPLMVKSQSLEDIHQNISFEIQRMMFFNSMLKHNMFFKMNYNIDEWLQILFDHCNKLILLVLIQISEDGQGSRKSRNYEVTENYTQDYTSQKTVFELHFWYTKTTNQSIEAFDTSVLHGSESKNKKKNEDKNKLSKDSIEAILTETLSAFHYLVELRHKYLCACTNEQVHDEIWDHNLMSKDDSFIETEEAYEYSQNIGKLVLDSVTNKNQRMKNCKRVPPLTELFDKYINGMMISPSVSHSNEDNYLI